jgi:hypothetical protein
MDWFNLALFAVGLFITAATIFFTPELRRFSEDRKTAWKLRRLKREQRDWILVSKLRADPAAAMGYFSSLLVGITTRLVATLILATMALLSVFLPKPPVLALVIWVVAAGSVQISLALYMLKLARLADRLFWYDSYADALRAKWSNSEWQTRPRG